MDHKEIFKQAVVNLFTKGEILKAHVILSSCIPADLDEDEDILNLKKTVEERLDLIKKWDDEGREAQNEYATLPDPLAFPKFQLAYDLIKSEIALRSDAPSILDVGCYTADFLKLLSKDNKLSCHGVDIYKDLMEKLNKESNGNPQFYFGSVLKLPQIFDMKFDIIMAMDVLEHCFGVNLALDCIELVAKPDALIIINLPRMTPFYRDEALEHLVMFSDKDLKRVFGNKKNYKFQLCQDELGRDTSFITYRNAYK